ncbi:elongator complex protein 2-like [Tetranychus urticae]|uniref:Elongator complex protein 2 n=1 Tax=Tetranychus urticae TaxID=32264 RepID=T1KH64_TETUR|nr:elongator complex protein 2-like [Tetranychus urticae]XP_015786836.1 elongator complex protein 2-like [Tetranychus urticae]XP_015786837.1 elongator complex protein 2-like [Tetranychus urticae]
MKGEVFNHEISYLSANCNRKPHAFDIRNNLLLYPSNLSICIYDFVKQKHVQLINGHTKPINCVRWIESVDSFVSSSLDGLAIIWTKQGDSYVQKYKCSGIGDGLIAVDSIVTTMNFQSQSQNNSNNVNYLTCASSNSEQLGLWLNDELVASINVHQFIFDLRLMQNEQLMFGNDVAFIGLVGSDSLVHLVAIDNFKNVHNLMKLSGHENWIQSIDLLSYGSDTLYLATGSQDNFIRVWKISKIDSDHSERGRVFNLKGKYFEVEIETVLLGHEGWIYSVQFVNTHGGKIGLLSASMDKSIVLWQQSDDDEIWSESIRVGDVGGCALGFVGAQINTDLTKIIGQSFNGALHFWYRNKDSDTWSPEIGLGGHWELVTDLSWEPNGHFLLTCSLDQTTRLHAPWSNKDSEITWHEIARPQIHGYDLNCLTVIDGLTFASGAEEKVVRIFGGTKSFLQSFFNVSNIDLSNQLKVNRDLPECASVPPLGLSNKAIYSEVDMDEYFKTVVLDKPPLEEILQQNTLWPEIQKLYGHSYEIFTTTCNKERTLLATACKASKADSANMILWDIRCDFKKLQELHFHNLTITQIRFSPNDKYIVSVSRDRTWCLYEVKKIDDDLKVIKVSNTDKKTCLHSRIIWDVAWTPDNLFFITCSRDKKAIIWSLDETFETANQTGPVKAMANHTLVLTDPIMAIDIAYDQDSPYTVAFGLETGIILLYTWSLQAGWKLKLKIDNCHTSQIKKLRFKPGINKPDEHYLLASCADDRKVIIHKILLK